MLIMAKTKKRVPYADECSDEAHDDLKALIKEAMGEGEETEDVSNDMNGSEVSFHNIFPVSCCLKLILLLLMF